MKKYKTPKIDMENIISFTCSDSAIESVVEILNNLKSLGEIGSSRNIIVEWGGRYNKQIFFDGDGSSRVNNITINGLSEDGWNEEWKRLGIIEESTIEEKYEDIDEKYEDIDENWEGDKFFDL